MFDNPPAWTQPIANLTGWFDWQAIGAIGTMLAVWVALWQSSRGDRRDESRVRRDMFRARASIFHLKWQLARAIARLERAPAEKLVKDLIDPIVVQVALQELERLAADDLPSPGEWGVIRGGVETARELVASFDAPARLERFQDAFLRLHALHMLLMRGRDRKAKGWHARLPRRIWQLGHRLLPRSAKPSEDGPNGGDASPP